MISARHWRERRAPWHALVFWAWLACFVFSFAGSDLFHTINCPEMAALRAAAHAPTVSQQSVSQQWTASHALPLDVDCASCLLQLVGQGVLVALLCLLAPGFFLVEAANSRTLRALARALSPIARGPPVSVI